MTTYLQRTRTLLAAALLALALGFGLASVQQAYADEGGDSQSATSSTITNGTYAVPNLSCNLGMFNHFVTDSAVLQVSDDFVSLSFTTDGSTTSIQKYEKLAIGKASELFNSDDLVDGEEKYCKTLNGDPTIVEGALVDPDASTKQFMFTIEMTRAAFDEYVAGDGIPITIYNADKGGWYKPSSDPYLNLGVLGTHTIDLKPCNLEKMWVVVKAQLVDNVDGQDYLNVYLNSSSYDWLFSGAQDEAVASFDAKDTDARWSAKATEEITEAVYQTYAGEEKTASGSKAKYTIPVTISDEDTFVVPIVAYATDFSARQAEITLSQGVASFGNAEDDATVTVSSEIADVQVEETATLGYEGYVRPYAGAEQLNESSPLSNEWTSTLGLVFKDNTYDEAYAVTYEGKPPLSDTATEISDASTHSSVDSDGKLLLVVNNEYNTDPKKTQLDGDTIDVMMHVAADADYEEADTWVKRTIKLTFANRTTATAVISGDPLTLSPIDYDGDTVGIFKSDLTTAFGMWSNPSGDMVVSIEDGNKVHVTYTPNNLTVYKGFYIEATCNDKATWKDENYYASVEAGTTGTKTNYTLDFTLDDSYCGKAWPIAPVKVKDGNSTSAQYYLAIPSKDKLYEDGTYTIDLTSVPSMIKFSGHDDATLAPKVVFNGDDAWVVVNYRSSKGSAWRYSQLAWGTYDEVVAAGKAGVGAAPTFVEGKTAADGMSDDTVYSVAFALPISKIDLIAAVDDGTAMPYTIRYVHGYSDSHDFDWYKASTQGTITVANLQKASDATDVPADYASVLDQIAAVPADLTLYEESSVLAVTTALSAVSGAPKFASAQDEVGAMAKAIEDAVAALKPLPGDYSAVEAAKAKVPAEQGSYTDESWNAVQDAVKAVVEGKSILEQADIDAMAEAIEDAVAALELTPAAQAAKDAAEAATVLEQAKKAFDEAVANAKASGSVVDLEVAAAAATAFEKAAEIAQTTANLALDLAKEAGATDEEIAVLEAASQDASKLAEEAATVAKTTAEARDDAKANGGTYVAGAADLAKATVTAENATYTGKELKPAVVVKNATGKVLKEGADYKLTYKNNVNAGTATVSVEGIGVYRNAKSATFTIAKAVNSVTAKAKISKQYKVKKLKKKAQTINLPDAVAAFGTAKWTVEKKAKKNVLKLKNGVVKVKKGAKKGKYTLKLKASVDATSNYAEASTSVTVKVKVK